MGDLETVCFLRFLLEDHGNPEVNDLHFVEGVGLDHDQVTRRNHKTCSEKREGGEYDVEFGPGLSRA